VLLNPIDGVLGTGNKIVSCTNQKSLRIMYHTEPYRHCLTGITVIKCNFYGIVTCNSWIKIHNLIGIIIASRSYNKQITLPIESN